MDDVRVAYANSVDAYHVAARIGARTWTGQFLGLMAGDAFELGLWDEWIQLMLEATEDDRDFYRGWALSEQSLRLAFRGDTAEARRLMDEAIKLATESGQAEAGLTGAVGMIDLSEGKFGEAFDRMRSVFNAEADALNVRWAIAAALLLGDADRLSSRGDDAPAAPGRAGVSVPHSPQARPPGSRSSAMHRRLTVRVASTRAAACCAR